MTGMAGSAQLERAEAQPFFISALNGVYDGKLVPVPGGIFVRDKRGAFIGAVDVTGDVSDDDRMTG